jgi:hypothetical protein
MLRIERSVDGDTVSFTISGRIEAVHVEELQRLIDEETGDHRRLVLDLKDVKLVARDAVALFVQCEERGITVNNCPGYVREWIRHELDGAAGTTIPRAGRRKTPKKRVRR